MCIRDRDEPSLILVLYSVLIGPVCEELIFRGLTLKYAKRAMPFWVANFLQALLFGVFHMNMIQDVYKRQVYCQDHVTDKDICLSL